jgi:hypothetical protein
MLSPWNKQVAVLFSRYYVNHNQALTTNCAAAEKAFLAHIPALCKQARKMSSTEQEDAATVSNRRRIRRRQVC